MHRSAYRLAAAIVGVAGFAHGAMAEDFVPGPVTATTISVGGGFQFLVRPDRVGTRLMGLTLVGGGWGHGVGMCQVGAMGRARAGWDYRRIRAAYYPGTVVRELY